ncbi:MAG: hypothetical protein P8I38_13670 [Arenicella sp.]|jgi:succinoglycan biosynthesis transport protein ExoP|nr:hypothetical protein [Arenicella sp.]
MAVEPSSVRNSSQSIFDPYASGFYQTQYELIKSRSVARRVVEDLKLAERSDVSSMLVVPSLRQQLTAQIESKFGIEIFPPQPAVEPDVSSLEFSDAELEARKVWLTNIVKGGVNVDGGEKTHLVKVTFNSTNPEFAAEVANALVTAYIDQGLDSQADRS